MKKVRKYLKDMLSTHLYTEQINDLGRNVDPSFDVKKVSGFGEHIVIPRQVAADCILSYFSREPDLIRFIEFLIGRIGLPASGGIVQFQGGEKQLLRLLVENNYRYDEKNKRLMQDQSRQKSSGWGYMQSGQEVSVIFSSIDIVMSSELTRTNIREDVETTMNRFRKMVFQTVEKYNGRIWQWQGDGGIAVFLNEEGCGPSIIAMVELLGRLPVFNISYNDMKAGSEIRLRIGMAHGPVEYHVPVESITSVDMELAKAIEKDRARPNGLAITEAMHQLASPEIQRAFQAVENLDGHGVVEYIGR